MNKDETELQGECIHSETGAYGEVRVFENDSLRWLQFDNDAVQSIMSLQYPDRIALPYMQQMMAALLFCDHPPCRALMLGMGGGAMLRFLRHCLKHISFEVVERDAHVIRIANEYFNVGHDGEDVIVEHDDVDTYIANHKGIFDLLLLDIIEDMSTPTCFFDESFFQHCRNRCGETGVFAMNLIVENEDAFKTIYTSIRKAFEGRVVCLTDPDHSNIVVLAFAHQPDHVERQLLQERAELLSTCHIDLSLAIDTIFEVNPNENERLDFSIRTAE